MDSAQRIEAIHAKLNQLKVQTESVGATLATLGPPCKQCRYFKHDDLYPKCNHPINHTPRIEKFDFVSDGEGWPKLLRATTGLCGPEAVLFEAIPALGRVPWFAVAGAAWAAGFVWLGFAVLGPLAIMAALGFMGPQAEIMFGRWR